MLPFFTSIQLSLIVCVHWLDKILNFWNIQKLTIGPLLISRDGIWVRILDIGNITLESEDNTLLKTFDNPFKFKCDICEFIAKSERGLKSHRTRKHENCEWCEYICDSESDMKKHKMDEHTLKYSRELLVGLMGKSPW